jgi:hypothetical protein
MGAEANFRSELGGAARNRGRREGDGGEGKTVIRLKFKIHFANSIFLLLHGLK